MFADYLASLLVLAVFVSPAAGVLLDALPADHKIWAAVTWLGCGAVLFFAPDGTPVPIGIGLAVAIVIAAVIIDRGEADDPPAASPDHHPECCETCGNRTNWHALWARRRGADKRSIIAWVCRNCGDRVDIYEEKPT